MSTAVTEHDLHPGMRLVAQIVAAGYTVSEFIDRLHACVHTTTTADDDTAVIPRILTPDRAAPAGRHRRAV